MKKITGGGQIDPPSPPSAGIGLIEIG